MKNLIRPIILILILFSHFPTMSATANLGETINLAKQKEKEYKAKYGAILPIYKTNKEGLIIFECWAAPAEMWDFDQAMSFAKVLLPDRSKFKSATPMEGEKDGNNHNYKYPDGTIIILTHAFKGKYIGLSIQMPEYSGRKC